MSFAAEFGTGQVLWSILWFALFVLWIYLLITVFSDIMRARDLSGWGKALWAVAIIILPLLGIFLYLIVNGDKMHRRDEEDARAAEEARQRYVREAAAASTSTADELDALARLHEDGTLSDDEYDRAKSKVVNG